MKTSNIAILIDPLEAYPPSNSEFVKHLIKVGHDNFNISLSCITKAEMCKLTAYNGLFIRVGTSIHDYTYQWSLFAEFLKLNLIDTPMGISLGSNKHLQYELCKRHNVKTPLSYILYAAENIDFVIEHLPFSFPFIIKTPSGSFSTEVFKVENREEFINLTKKLFYIEKHYALIVQEFLYTTFDWRIGILNKKPLFACKYYMVENHWQVIKYENNKVVDEGFFDAIKVKDLPQNILNFVSNMTKLVDSGFYGLDLKEVNGEIYLIEINDNPNLFYDVEDSADRENIYNEIIGRFMLDNSNA